MASGAKGWPSYGYLAGAAATLLLVLAASRLVGEATTPIFLVIVGILLAFLVHYPIELFARVMPRPLAALLTLLLLLGALAGGGLWLAPRLYHQASLLIQRIPEAIQAASAALAELQRHGPLAALPESAHLPQTVERQLVDRLASLISNALPLAYDVLAMLIAVVFVLGVAFFLAYRPALYVEGLLRLVPPLHQESVRSFLDRLGFVIRGWIVGALVSMISVGTLTAVGTLLFGLESWLFLGVVAFGLEIIPYAGPILSAVPALALALSESPTTAFYTALLYLGIQQVEGNLITPIVMKRAIELPPALLLLWQVAMASAFGLVALFVAAPLLAALMVAVDHFYVRRIHPE